jgi:hypothetical protein
MSSRLSGSRYNPQFPLELILGDLSSEGLKAYGRAKRAVFVNCSVDVGRIKLKPRLTQHNLAFDGELDNASFASFPG